MTTQEQFRTHRSICCWIGSITGFTGNILMHASVLDLGTMLWLGGLILCLLGGYYWTRYKARSGWFTLWALLAPIGFIGLAVLEDRFVGARKDSGAAWGGD